MADFLSNIFVSISNIPILSAFKVILIGNFEVVYNIFTHFLRRNAKFNLPKSENKKIVVITGGTKGIGKAMVEKLAISGYFLILLSRDRTEMEKLKQKYGADCIAYAFLDLSNPNTIIRTAKNILKDVVKDKKIFLVINNAGVYYRKISHKYAIEYNFLINHIGHYVLVESLKDNIEGRIVNVSSSAMYSTADIYFAENIDFLMDNYAKSKYANALHSLMLKKEGFDSVAVHPGIVATSLFDNTRYGRFVRVLNRMAPFLFTSVDDASDNVLFACFTDKVHPSKKIPDFFMNKNRANVPLYVNKDNAQTLKDRTFKMCLQFGMTRYYHNKNP